MRRARGIEDAPLVCAHAGRQAHRQRSHQRRGIGIVDRFGDACGDPGTHTMHR
jgi:hypothetical protein